MDLALDSADCGQGNPDIAGIGTRVGFYVQTIILVFIVDRSWEDAPGSLWTLTATSFGLTFAAVFQAVQGKLSLFQALQVSNLVWMANFSSLLAVASYSRYRERSKREKREKQSKEERDEQQGGGRIVGIQNTSIGGKECKDGLEDPEEDQRRKEKRKESDISQPDNLIKQATVIQISFSMALTLLTWAKQDIFSNDAMEDLGRCNVQYVMFFAKSFPARGSGRTLALIITSILSTVFLSLTVHEIWEHRQKGKHAARLRNESETNDKVPAVTISPPRQNSAVSVEITWPIGGSPTGSTLYSPSVSTPPSLNDSTTLTIPPSRVLTPSPTSRSKVKRSRTFTKGPQEKRKFFNTELDPMTIGLMIVQLVLFAYFVTCTELLLQRNPASDNANSQWGFGQILSLVIVLPSLVSLFRAFKEKRFRKFHRRGKCKQGSRDSESAMASPTVVAVPQGSNSPSRRCDSV